MGPPKANWRLHLNLLFPGANWQTSKIGWNWRKLDMHYSLIQTVQIPSYWKLPTCRHARITSEPFPSRFDRISRCHTRCSVYQMSYSDILFLCRYTAKLMEYVSDHFLTSAHIHQALSFPALVPSLERRHKTPSRLHIPAAPELNWILNKCQSEFYINSAEHGCTSSTGVRVSVR